MKARPFSLFYIVIVMALLVPGGARPVTAAQSQPVVPVVSVPSTGVRVPPASGTRSDDDISAKDQVHVADALYSAPLMFVENVGQFDERARFQVRGGNATIHLAEDAVWVTLVEKPPSPQSLSPDPQAGMAPLPTPAPGGGGRDENQPGRGVNLKLSFVGANPRPQLEPFNRLDTHVSYFSGNDPAQWYADVPVWGGVRYGDLYPGVDLEMIGTNGQWVWRMVARDDADVDAVRLRVEGADAIDVDDSGCLRLDTVVGDIEGPTVITARDQELFAVPVEVDTFKFTSPSRAGAESNALLLVEAAASGDNPADLAYSTFLGGSSIDAGNAIAVGSDGAVYVTGETESADFPTTPGSFDTDLNGASDIFVTNQ